MFEPLSGMRVVDLSQVLAGPYATYQLALMGAEVIKIERPVRGDWTRNGGSVAALSDMQMGLPFLTQNANKKSLTIDLKSSAGLSVTKRLIQTADVFVENFSPGTAAGLGLGFEDVREINPRIVYCSISAYGQDGPMSHRPAYDHVVQGMCGIMEQTGAAGSGPTKVGAPYIDYATGLNAAFAIVSALHEVKRTETAVHVDVAMLDTSMMLMASLMTNCLTAGWKPEQSGNEAWSQSPSSGAFDTADGVLMLAANTDPQFERLCVAIDRADILDDPRWQSPEARKLHADALRQEFSAVFSTQSADFWEERLDQARVPAARVRSMDEVLAEDQLKARGIMSAMTLPRYDKPVHVPTLGFKVNGEITAAQVPPPELNQDAQALLCSIGLNDTEIAAIKKQGTL
ncbi:MAG: CaiB/BaiF CoA transferase family protein [Hyphomicrobiaceae bacterium]